MLTIKNILRVLARITMAPSCIEIVPHWEVTEALIADPLTPRVGGLAEGYMLRISFERLDTLTGQMGIGYGRWLYLPEDAPDDAIIKTAWLAYDLLVRHEFMERFLVDGARLFDPHATVEALTRISREH